MTYLAITVLGHDRPGIIAGAAEALSSCGMNLEDSSMTLLRGHFAMMLICSGDAGIDDVETALSAQLDDSLTVSVREVTNESAHPTLGHAYLITVHGADRLGIVARLAGVVASAGGNITDLTTRLVGNLYVLAAEADLPADVDVAALTSRVKDVATDLGVDASLRPLERDEL